MPNLINDERLEELLAAAPAPRVTKAEIEGRIENTSFQKIGETVTICQIELDNGYSVRGESACVNAENYNQEIGERLAHDSAFSKLWPLFGFLLAEKEHAGESEPEAEKTADCEETGESSGENNAALADQIHARIAGIHKDSGVSSDVTAAINSAVKEVLSV